MSDFIELHDIEYVPSGTPIAPKAVQGKGFLINKNYLIEVEQSGDHSTVWILKGRSRVGVNIYERYEHLCELLGV